MFDEIDLSAIQDEPTRQAMVRMLNLIEQLSADLREAQALIQRLRDENNRLKGEQGQPQIKANTPQPPTSYSSEPERHQARRHAKVSKQATIRIDREEVVTIDPATLPADASFKGYQDVVVQDIALRTDNVCFHKQKYYAASTGQSYLAPLPAGYGGQFGPGVKALALALYFGMGASAPKIREFLRNVGLEISDGEVSNLLIKEQAAFHAEKDAVYEAGLHSSPWQHTDDTQTRVNGQNQHCHVVCNPVYTAYHTRPTKARLTVLDVLRNGRPRRFRLNAEALAYREPVPLSKATRHGLHGWCSEHEMAEPEFLQQLAVALPKLGRQQRQAILDAAAVAAYHAATEGPVLQALICDDAPQFHWLTRARMLCWVHEGRPYKKLTPVVGRHRVQLDAFLTRFWDYYDQLLSYRQAPTRAERERLAAAFDSLFGSPTGYAALDQRMAKTRAKKASLLLVLQFPELPLHNNPAELGVRLRVRKRDVSFGPRTADGVRAWDTFMTLAATTKKLGVSFYAYIHDRIARANQIPPLASLVAQAAKELNLGWSWHHT